MIGARGSLLPIDRRRGPLRRKGAGPAPDQFDRRLITPMVLGSILNPVNSTMLAVALVPIGIAFGAPASETAWLVSGLYLATAVGQPVVGRLVDLYGPRRLFLLGALLIGAGGILGTLAPSLLVLVVARVVLGLGTCAGYPAAMNLIRREAERTGRESPATILTVLAVSTQTISVIGPTLGGLLIGLGGWRTTFAVNVPLALAALVLGALILPRTEVAPRTRPLAAVVDAVGIALFSGALVTLLLFLARPEAAHWWLAAIAVGAAAGFVGWELRAATPFLDVRVLAGNGPLLATYARSLLFAVSSYALIYGVTQWLEEGRGLGASATGLVLLPIFATGLGISTLTGRRPEIHGKLVVGAIGQVVVAALLFLLDAASPIWLIVVVALIAGLPQGLNNLANQNAVYHQADPNRLASSSGLMRTFFYLGAISASSANGIVLSPRADDAGLHELAIVMLAAAVIALVITIADRSLGHIMEEK